MSASGPLTHRDINDVVPGVNIQEVGTFVYRGAPEVNELPAQTDAAEFPS